MNYIVFSLLFSVFLPCFSAVVVPAGSLSAVNDAIASAQPGEQIILSSGTFYGCEVDTIVLNKNITLKGW